MLAFTSSAVGYTAPAARPAVQVRTQAPQMYNIQAFDNVWGLEAKTAVFNVWDPEKPRDYENFNPFESNDESAKCDSNGCFPGQSRGYRPPNRPDASWSIMQAEKVAMEELAKDPKFGLKGKPGCFFLNWQKSLGMPPIYD